MNNEKTTRAGATTETKPGAKDTTTVDPQRPTGDRAPATPADLPDNYRVLNLQKARAKKRVRSDTVVEDPPPKKPRVEAPVDTEDDEVDNEDETIIRRVNTPSEHTPLPTPALATGSMVANMARTLLSTALFTAGAISVSISSSFFKRAMEERFGVKKAPTNQWML